MIMTVIMTVIMMVIMGPEVRALKSLEWFT